MQRLCLNIYPRNLYSPPKSPDKSKPLLVLWILHVGHQMVGHVSDTRLECVMFTGHTCLENRTHVLLRKGPWLMFSHASCSCEVFRCAAKGYLSLLMLFKEVPTPSISPTVVINGNNILLYLSFPSFSLNF